MYYSELGNHIENAEIEDKALFYFEKAGNLARDNYQNHEALVYYNKLLSHFEWIPDFIENLNSNSIPDDKRKDIQKFIDVSLEKAKILQLVGNWNEAIKICNDTIRIAEIIGDDIRNGRAEMHLGTKLYMKGSYEDAIEHFKKSLDRYKKTENKIGVGRAISNMGMVFWRQGKTEDAMKSFETTREISENQKDHIGIAKALGNIGLMYQTQRNFSKAMEYYNKQLEIDEKIGDKIGISTVT